MNELSKCAHLCRLAYFDMASVVAEFPDMVPVVWIDEPLTDTQGFIMRDGPVTYVVFRGTKNLADVLRDGMIGHTPISASVADNAGWIHQGFGEAFIDMWDPYSNSHTFNLGQFIRDESRTSRRIVFTGHSAGGAIACIAAFAANKVRNGMASCRTFGSPQTGDKRFVAAYNQTVPDSIRCVLSNDLVPSLPGLDFRHVGVELMIDGMGSALGIIKRYLKKLFRRRLRVSDLTSFTAAMAHHHVSEYCTALQHAAPDSQSTQVIQVAA